MKIELFENCVEVTREKGDKGYYSSNWGSAESQLLYDIKKELTKRGFDLIKKRMWKDGHLVDDDQQYLRTRKKTGIPEKDIYIWNGSFALYDAGRELMEQGKVALSIVYNIF